MASCFTLVTAAATVVVFSVLAVLKTVVLVVSFAVVFSLADDSSGRSCFTFAAG